MTSSTKARSAPAHQRQKLLRVEHPPRGQLAGDRGDHPSEAVAQIEGRGPRVHVIDAGRCQDLAGPLEIALATVELNDKIETAPGKVSIGTMPLTKGLEFRAVAVMPCDDQVIPSQERIENVADDADLEEVYDSERHLLYVACTRARDELLVTGVKPASEFLSDLAQ